MLTDPAPERLRSCVAALAEDDAGHDPMKLDAVLAEIEDVIASLESAPGRSALAPQRSLCGAKGHGATDGPCDRPERHKGDCSWMVGRIRRLAQEYETEATQAPYLRNRVAKLERDLKKANKELDVAHLAAEGWRQRWSARRKARAEERG